MYINSSRHPHVVTWYERLLHGRRVGDGFHRGVIMFVMAELDDKTILSILTDRRSVVGTNGGCSLWFVFVHKGSGGCALVLDRVKFEAMADGLDEAITAVSTSRRVVFPSRCSGCTLVHEGNVGRLTPPATIQLPRILRA